MTVSTGDVVRVTAVLEYEFSGEVLNTFWFQNAGNAVSDTDFMDAAADCLDEAYNYLNDMMPTELAFVEIQGFNITTENPLPATDWPTLTAGTSVGGGLPAPVSVLALGRTGESRSMKKNYFAPFTETQMGDARWAAALIADVVTAFNTILAGFEADGQDQVGGVWSETLQEFLGVIETVVSGVSAYQRRRKSGRGS